MPDHVQYGLVQYAVVTHVLLVRFLVGLLPAPNVLPNATLLR